MKSIPLGGPREICVSRQYETKDTTDKCGTLNTQLIQILEYLQLNKHLENNVLTTSIKIGITIHFIEKMMVFTVK